MRLMNSKYPQLFALVLSLVAAADLQAKEAAPMAADPEVERKTMEISHELRCLVCQNQTIADSNAPLAVDLRREVREMVAQGMDQKDVVEFMENRYGDFVRYMPSFKASTALLWIGPFVLMAGAVAILLFNLAKRRRAVDERSPLSEEEQKRIAALLKEPAASEKSSS